MASLSDLLARGQARLEEFLRDGVETWVLEGRIDAARRDQLIATLNTPEVERTLLHAGAHFAISLPLRFPFGATARFFYTLGMRLKAESSWLFRRGDVRHARRSHTFVVMLFALLPGFGRLAYFLSPALANERLLMVVPLDVVARKLPFQTYRRFHLSALFVYWAQPEEPGRGLRHFLFGGWFQDLKQRLAALRPHAGLIAIVLVINIGALLIGAYIYLASGQDSEWWFDEGNVNATLGALQLLLAGFLGMATYRLFWTRRPFADAKEAAGIFLWGIGGAGLILFAIDDYLGLHEQLGRHFERGVNALPVALNMPDDLLVLLYAAVGLTVLFFFRMELFEDRASATLLQMAAVAALVMVTVDAFATSRFLLALEYPSQTLANALLLLAFSVRYLEVTKSAPELAAGILEVRSG